MATEPHQPVADALKIDIPADFAGGCSQPIIEMFESAYGDAHGEAARVPWEDGGPSPLLTSWLNDKARLLVRPGSRTAVVGCGLGDDVVEIAERGYDVIGFDVSPTAIRWATRRHPHHAERFVCADLLALPGRLMNRFDFVVEIFTIQSVPPGWRAAVAKGIANLLTPRGVALTVCRAREPSHALDSCLRPPWPLTQDELIELMMRVGLSPVEGETGIEAFMDAEDPPQRRLRAVFARA